MVGDGREGWEQCVLGTELEKAYYFFFSFLFTRMAKNEKQRFPKTFFVWLLGKMSFSEGGLEPIAYRPVTVYFIAK